VILGVIKLQYLNIHATGFHEIARKWPVSPALLIVEQKYFIFREKDRNAKLVVRMTDKCTFLTNIGTSKVFGF
jgi:hypothetical protein